MSIFKKYALILAIILCSFTAYGAPQGLFLQLGLFQHNILDLTKDQSGKASTWGDSYLPLALLYSTPVFETWFFVPSLHFTHLTSLLMKKETIDDNAQKEVAFLSLPLSTNVMEWFEAKFGIGFFRYEIKGKGGSTRLSNGTGTSEFYRPNRDHVAHNLYWLVGMAFPGESWRLDIDFLIQTPLSSERRSYGLLVGLATPIGFGE